MVRPAGKFWQWKAPLIYQTWAISIEKGSVTFASEKSWSLRNQAKKNVQDKRIFLLKYSDEFHTYKARERKQQQKRRLAYLMLFLIPITL